MRFLFCVCRMLHVLRKAVTANSAVMFTAVLFLSTNIQDNKSMMYRKKYARKNIVLLRQAMR